MISKLYIPNPIPNEKIVFHLHRHWFIFLKIILGLIGLFLLPVIIYFFLMFSSPAIFQGQIAYPILLVFASSYYLLTLVFMMTIWMHNFLDVWTVTTERIIAIDQKGLFNRVVAELDLYHIEDIAAEQKGFMATIFHYGDVYIQTAGERERFIFAQVPNPYQVAKILQKLDETSKQNHNYNADH